MIRYYQITTILSLINLLIMIFRFQSKKMNYYFTFLGLLMTLSCGGHLFLALSTTLPEAILANKICYIGGCFVPPVVLFCICAICNYKVASWLRNLFYAYSFIVYCIVLTTGINDFYYTDVQLAYFHDAAILSHGYGIGHLFFNAILYGYMLLEILLLIYSFYKQHSVSRKNLWALTILEVINSVLFIISRSINSPLEIMPLMYVIDGWILLYLHRRTTMYNIEDCIIGSLGKQDTYGYIMLDNYKNYLGCNSIASQIIPELSNCKIDLPIPNIPQLDLVLYWINEFSRGNYNTFSYEAGPHHYQCSIEHLWHRNRACGYIIEMQEDTAHWNYMNLLSSYNFELEAQVKEKTEHITNIQSQILVGIADMVENRDDSTGGHIKRTSDVIRILIETIQEKKLLPLEKEFCLDIINAAPMHDLGKIGIDDNILRKPDKLTEEEFAIMQTHAEKSAKLVEGILKGVEEEHFVQVAINVARYHHEKWNGTGYPTGLKGADIPLEARIMAIADVYDALISKRAYKEEMSFEQVFEIMMNSMGTHFDPGLEQVFILSRERLEKYYETVR